MSFLKKAFPALIVCLLIVTFFAACSSTQTDPTTAFASSSQATNGETEPANGRVSLDRNSATIGLFETLTLTASTENVTGSLIWSSSDDTVATVNDGVVTPVKEGTVTITVSVGEINDNCVVTVESSAQMPVLTVDESVSLKEGQEFVLMPSLAFNGETLSAAFEYICKDPTVASVDNGKITGLAIGSTTVTVTAEYRGVTAAKVVTVTVTANVSFELSELSVVLGTMETEKYVTCRTVTAEVYENNTAVDDPTIVWASMDTAVATVSNGVITAVGAGETTVSATYTSNDGNETVVYVGVVVEKPVFEGTLENALVDFGDDQPTGELALTGIGVNPDDIVRIFNTSSANAEISFGVVDGRVMIDRKDVSIGPGTIRLESTKAVYDLNVRYTCDEYTIMRFESDYDASKIAMFYTGYMDASVDTSVKYGDDKGSLKFTVTDRQEWNAIYLNLLELTDIADYDYITFRVYNPTEKNLVFTLMWCGDTTIPNNSWGEVKFPTKLFYQGKVQDIDGNLYSTSDITALALVVYRGDWENNESFYLSSIKVGKEVIEPGRENVMKPFDREVGSINLPSSHGTAEYTTEMHYGEEQGALKLTVSLSGEVYLGLNTPLITDMTPYDYIVFRVYNTTNASIGVGTMWAADTVCSPGVWTEIRIPVSLFNKNSITGFPGTPLPITDISGIVIRFINGFKPGDVFYVSAVWAEKKVIDPERADILKAFDIGVNDINLPVTHGTAEYTTEMHYGDEQGSLKLTVLKDSEIYLGLNTTLITDVSEFDYIVFRVYNDSNSTIGAGTMWMADTNCAPGEWTEIRIATSGFDKGWITGFPGTPLPIDDISGMVIRLISGFKSGDVFYISAVRVIKEGQ